MKIELHAYLKFEPLWTDTNYILPGKDGKTPAERLGLAQAPLDYEDIIYFP